jgi:hypothetical protein
MKRSFVISTALLLGLAICTMNMQSAEAQTGTKSKSAIKAPKKLEGSNVSEMSKTHFYADFGNIPNAEWRRSINFDEAKFIKDGKDVTAFYDYDANLVGTCTPKTFADLPAAGQKEIKAKYKDYSVGPVILFDDNEANDTEMILYGLQFEDANNYFVELAKGNDKVVVMINPEGVLSFFKKL